MKNSIKPRVNMKIQRQKANLPQRWVSQKLGFLNGAQTISDYETGRREPSWSTMIKLAKLYNCSLDDFIDDDVFS